MVQSYYPGHMAKAKRALKEKLSWCDMIIELADARAPHASRNETLYTLGKHKPRLLVLGKEDLADKEALERSVDAFEASEKPVFSLNVKDPRMIKQLISKIRQVAEPAKEKRRRKGLEERAIRALVVGVPNVGKSTLINQLVKKRVTDVADTPHITKDLQVIRIHEDLELIDSPGMLWPRLDDTRRLYKLSLLGALKDVPVHKDEVVIHGLEVLFKHYREALFSRYDFHTESFDTMTILDAIGRRMGCLSKGGEIDYDRVLDVFLKDFRNGRFGRVSLEFDDA